MERLPELLSPAGDEAAFRAAVDSGADAVYLGAKAFGARASAVNFGDESLAEAVRYAHLYHARVYVTVNTLVKQKEYADVRDLLCSIRDAGADAVIVQDLGVAGMVRDEFPELGLHASTQMALSNAEDALFAKCFGFERVVLARECTLEEIRRVVAAGIETEVFAHGALCTSVSGRCLMSSMSGGRSGNRGRCAQPCRKEVKWGDRTAAWLSLKDLCTLQQLPAFCQVGVTSLKLEGRLKSPEYVAVVTAEYRRALDAIKDGSFDPEDPAPILRLKQIFNRGGFTKGHAFLAEDADLCATKRVSHEGVLLGKVLAQRGRLADVRLSAALHNEDSLQLRSGRDHDIRYSGPDVPAGEVATLRLRPEITVKKGDTVARLSDAAQLEAARNIAPKKIPVSMKAVFEKDQPMQLTLSDGSDTVTVQGDIVSAASNRAAQAEDVIRQLTKLGDTPFTLSGNVELSLQEGLFLPVSALNALRRETCDAMKRQRTAAFGKNRSVRTHEKPLPVAVQERKAAQEDYNRLTVVFSDPDLAQSLMESGAEQLWFSPCSYRPNDLEKQLAKLPKGVCLQLPVQCTSEMLQELETLVDRYANTLGGIVAESLGQLNMDWGLPVVSGLSIPITNQAAVRCLERTAASSFVLWPEWNNGELLEMLPDSMPRLLKVYGREELMLLNHCPKRVEMGLKQNRRDCSLCTTPHMTCGRENAILTDQRGYSFPLKRTAFPEGCIISVYNALPTDLSRYEEMRPRLKAGMLLRFTVEPPQEQLRITREYAALLRDGVLPSPVESTAGHFHRGAQ